MIPRFALGCRIVRWAGLSIACWVFVTLFWIAPSHGEELTDVEAADHAEILIDPDNVVRAELPSTLIGFNINHFHFQNDLWQQDREQVAPIVIEKLRRLPGALYRYPGGLIANLYWWEEAVGPVADRQPQRSVRYADARPVLFGVQEYLEFVKSVDGYPWYVLNLVGWHSSKMIEKLPAAEIAQSNAALAKYIAKHDPRADFPRYYQLGNELDRAEYQWSHQEYIQRAKSTIDSISAVDPDARFVAFLRDFDWTYRGGERDGTVSRYTDLMADVLQGLPEVEAFSLHFYYDDPGMEGRKPKQIPWRLAQFRRAISAAAQQRRGETLQVWVTEHARGINYPKGRGMDRRRLTSNLKGTVSTGDFLIALAQMPSVQGASWHGLNAGPWQIFDASIEHGDLRPRPIYFGLRVLRAVNLPTVVATRTRSPNHSGYGGGYDVRAVAFTDSGGDSLGLWVVNRAQQAMPVTVRLTGWRKQAVEVRHFHISGPPGVDPDQATFDPTVQLEPDKQQMAFSQDGTLVLDLPPMSVSGFLIDKRLPAGMRGQ